MMKKIYFMAMAALFCTASIAQIPVTFRVDMSDQTVSGNGVHVAGNWQAAAGFADDWQPGISEMTDAGGGIYELDVTVPPAAYEFKYINGNNWGMDEGVPGDVASGDNRFFAVTVDGHQIDGFTLPAVKFGQAAPEGMGFARVSVDMALFNDLEETVHIAGDFDGQFFDPITNPCVNTQGTTWSYVIYDTPGEYQYKFYAGPDFANENEWSSGGGPAECTNGTYRTVELTTGGVVTPAYCFNDCETCLDPTEVTFRVDMNGAGELAPEGAIIAGTFTDWAANEQPMTDEGDGIWSYTTQLLPGDINWKFKNGPGGWEDGIVGDCQEGGDRAFTVPESTDPVEVGPFCFASCEASCNVPDPAQITFRVDMNDEDVSPEGVFLISGFLGWQGGALQMTDNDGDGVYEVTVNFSGPAQVVYKYVNGDVNVAANEEFDGLEESPGHCVVPSGVGGWNRVHQRSGSDEVLVIVQWEDCGTLSVRNQAELGAVNIFPNPSFGSTFIEVENPNGYNLRMNIMDITGKIVRENILLNTGRKEINTSNFAPGLYLLNVTNQHSERAVYKLMVR